MIPRAEPIATERLLLEPLRTDHAEPMAAVLADPGLYRHIGGAPPTVAGLRRRYTAMLAGPDDPDQAWLNWIITAPEPAGTVQATLHRAPGAASGTTSGADTGTGAWATAAVAWVVGTPWQGRGLARESARALVGRLTENGVRCVTAAIAPGNRASERVARACGMGPTGDWQDRERIWRLGTPPTAPPG